MNLSTLKPTPGSKKTKMRKGRGPGSHLGKTGGRGQDGAGSRPNPGISVGYEGGQMPLQRRLPKRGFRSRFPRNVQIVNLADLEKKCEGTVTGEDLVKAGLVKKADRPIKILGKGSLSKSLKVKVNFYSASAKKAIEAANGVAEVA
jgi:large subunit ribosomal protein L15